MIADQNASNVQLCAFGFLIFYLKIMSNLHKSCRKNAQSSHKHFAQIPQLLTFLNPLSIRYTHGVSLTLNSSVFLSFFEARGLLSSCGKWAQ